MVPQPGEAFGEDVGLYGSEHDVPRPVEASRVYGRACIFYRESERAVSFTSDVERHHDLLPLFVASRMWSRKPDCQNLHLRQAHNSERGDGLVDVLPGSVIFPPASHTRCSVSS
jgi:hypothetical protein